MTEETSENEQLNAWKSEFGDAYTERNVYDPDKRLPAFREMVGDLHIKRILEVGCNIGNNLITLSKISNYELIGIEPNKHAIEKGRARSTSMSLIEGSGFDVPFVDSYFDLVFTVGVLIHIAPQNMPKIIDEMYRVSNKYLLVVEYHANEETKVPYHGKDNLLFKRNFKKAFLERKPDIECIKEGFWKSEDGFDDCAWHLFRKS